MDFLKPKKICLSLALILVMLSVGAPAWSAADKMPVGLSADGFSAISERFKSFSDDLPKPAMLGVEKITAFEEQPRFVFVQGESPRLTRRLVFLKPDIFVVDDCSKSPGLVERTVFAVKPGEKKLLAGMVIKVQAQGKRQVERFGTDSRLNPAGIVRDKGGKAVIITCEMEDCTYHLRLPDDPKQAGTIRISKNAGDLLPERLLPSGIMPHGEKGVQSLERWDGAYRRERMPGWDVGRPATELKKAVESGAIKPGRALVLGCGTGTNAVYLAQKGFTVTGVEVAPTALTLAAERAKKAGVKVRWVVADAIALPDLAAFDFIFDRGCYHHIQTYNAKGYAAQMRALSKTGTHMMILAGNANESRHYGPPRVEETKLVTDFAGGWDFVWLKEIRFDSARSDGPGSVWAWSMLLRRKADKSK